MLVGGDLNTQFPPVPPLGKAVTGSVWTERCSVVFNWANQWHLSWDSTRLPEGSYTHLHKCHDSTKVIDYVLSNQAFGCRGSVSCSIAHELSFNSDHYPLLVDYRFSAPRRKKTKDNRLPPLKSFACKNRFAALLDDALDDVGEEQLCGSSKGLECFADCIKNSHRKIVSDGVQSVPKDGPASLRNVIQPLVAAIHLTDNPVERRTLLKSLHTTRKRHLQELACHRFANKRLKAPKEQAASSTGAVFPLRCGNVLSMDPDSWKAEFESVYHRLLHDENNTSEVQYKRLRELRCKCAGESRIAIPSFILREVLGRGRSRGNSAPGADHVCWNALASVSGKAFCILRKLFEHRINGDPQHNMTLSSWSEVLVTMIPKRPTPELVSHWRPISLCSVVQKAFLAVTNKLIDVLSSPPSCAHLGFREGIRRWRLSTLLVHFYLNRLRGVVLFPSSKRIYIELSTVWTMGPWCTLWRLVTHHIA